ncbi:GntR family transcriptional regulator [Allomuricauda sp. SCSIO 65647]|uniref:GntR family transcriptional regulator n=1 Tax=Allomuricauda sp. SCSIO 65647 TaxID=2908843 RepID=UPI001F44BFA4|nr:GntR family transcriptional regulator [Muricauda sp. SCSIO 65647]UJH69234.1 GntR family transcriptional regulator [Muricauda sp. SCSIO 65647]
MDFKLDQKSPIPFHAQIEGYLRTLIVQEQYRNGNSFLPNEVTLAKKLGVSRNTVRQAVNTLVNEQLIARKKGVGTKVVNKRITTRLDNWISFTKEMRKQGIEVVNYAIDVSHINAIDEAYDALGISKPKKLWKLEKIRGSKKAKYLYSVSYFHPRVGITGHEDFTVPLYELLENQHDTLVATSKEKISAIRADKDLATVLEVAIDMPILKRERLVCDAGDRPVEYNIVYYHTDYFTYDIEIKREL